MRAVPAPVAIRAADKDIAKKLHLDFFETGAATSFALTLCRIKTESARIQSALLCQVGLSEYLADIIESANVHGRIRTRRFAKNGLINQNNIHELLPAF